LIDNLQKIDFGVYEDETEEDKQARELVKPVESEAELQALLSTRKPGQRTMIEFHSPFCRLHILPACRTVSAGATASVQCQGRCTQGVVWRGGCR